VPRTLLLLAALAVAACGSAEPEATPAKTDSAQTATSPHNSRLEAGVHTARTAGEDVNAAMAEGEGRLEAEARAAGDSTAVTP
jgi:hypothetical protein